MKNKLEVATILAVIAVATTVVNLFSSGYSVAHGQQTDNSNYVPLEVGKTYSMGSLARAVTVDAVLPNQWVMVHGTQNPTNVLFVNMRNIESVVTAPPQTNPPGEW